MNQARKEGGFMSTVLFWIMICVIILFSCRMMVKHETAEDNLKTRIKLTKEKTKLANNIITLNAIEESQRNLPYVCSSCNSTHTGIVVMDDEIYLQCDSCGIVSLLNMHDGYLSRVKVQHDLTKASEKIKSVSKRLTEAELRNDGTDHYVPNKFGICIGAGLLLALFMWGLWGKPDPDDLI